LCRPCGTEFEMGLSDNLFKPRDTRFHALATTEAAPKEFALRL